MGFKELYGKVKEKFSEAIYKGNHELMKYEEAIRMRFYNQPMIGGFLSRQVFFMEEQKLWIPIKDMEKDGIKENTIFDLESDENLYVISSIKKEEKLKEIQDKNHIYTYPCYEVSYQLLSERFTEETAHLSAKSLTENQQVLLKELYTTIQQKSFLFREKKDACLKLWQYFTECVTLDLRNHYVMHTFVCLANDLTHDMPSLLLKLFA